MPSEQPIFRPIATPDRLFIPLTSHATRRGGHPQPVGTVRAPGELLTETVTHSDAAAIAPVAGKILGFEKTQLTNGQWVESVELQTSPDAGGYEAMPEQALAPRQIIRTTDLGHWIDRLLGAGVSSARVSCPDLVGQLYESLSRPIDTVMCSVLDTDPGLPINSMIARVYSAEMAAGIDLLAKLFGSRRVWIVADTAAPTSWFASLDPLIRADGLKLIPLRGDYPQAHPTILLHTLLRRKLRPGRLPVEQGVFLLDAAAAVFIGHLLLHDRPLLHVPIAMRDHVLAKTHFLLAPVGSRLTDVCQSLQIPAEEVRFRGGEFLRDVFLSPFAVIGPGELGIHISQREMALNPDPCVRCAWCIEACPTRIHPVGLLDAAQMANHSLAVKSGLDSCIECGICSYVCPSRLPILSAIRKLHTIGPSSNRVVNS